MTTHRRWCAAALGTAALATGLCWGAPARAYVRTKTSDGVPIRWASNCIYITAHMASPPSNLTPAVAEGAVQAAAATWSKPQVDCTELVLQVALSPDADGPVGNDGHVNVMFRTDEWHKEPPDPDEADYDSGALAITTVFAKQSTGEIVDADTEINGVDWKWGDLVAGVGVGPRVQDLQNTLTHEFGHLLGLDHVCYMPGSPIGIDENGDPVPECDRAPPDVQAATMFAAVVDGDTARRTLSPDDVAGVCAIYPAVGGPMCDPVMGDDPPAEVGVGDDGGSNSGGGCTTGGRRGSPVALDGLLAVLGVALLGRRITFRRGTRPRALNPRSPRA